MAAYLVISAIMGSYGKRSNGSNVAMWRLSIWYGGLGKQPLMAGHRTAAFVASNVWLIYCIISAGVWQRYIQRHQTRSNVK